jgi:hypothetical protein
VAAFALLALLVVAARPYLYAIPLWPVSRDAAEWIVRGAPETPGWSDWVFATRHFSVGYRPLTALSYSAVHAAGGFAAPPQRGVDLALHLTCIALVFVLFRRLAAGRSVWGAWVAAAVFAAHPLAEEVVPHLARRSYSLSTALGLAALAVLCRSDGKGTVATGAVSRLRSGIAGVLLAGAVLANETALVAVGVAAALVVGAAGSGWRFSWSRVAALLAPVAAVGVLRMLVVSGVGGYEPEFDRAGRAIPIVLASWRALLGRVGAPDADGVAWLVCAGFVTLYYFWQAGWQAALALHRPERRVVALIFAWTLVFVALFAPLGVWFPRQVYPVLVPFSLLVGVVFADSLRLPPGGVRAWIHWIPQALLLAGLLWVSPLVMGSDGQGVAASVRTDALLRDLHQQALGRQENLAGLVIPHYLRPAPYSLRARERGGRPPLGSLLAEVWVQAALRGNGPRLQTLVVFQEGHGARIRRPHWVETDGLPAMDFDATRAVYLIREGVRIHREDGGQRVELLAGTPLDGPGALLYFHDGERGRMIPLDSGL